MSNTPFTPRKPRAPEVPNYVTGDRKEQVVFYVTMAVATAVLLLVLILAYGA